MLKIRRSRDRLHFNMEITIPGKDGLYIETGAQQASQHHNPMPFDPMYICVCVLFQSPGSVARSTYPIVLHTAVTEITWNVEWSNFLHRQIDCCASKATVWIFRYWIYTLIMRSNIFGSCFATVFLLRRYSPNRITFYFGVSVLQKLDYMSDASWFIWYYAL